MEVPPPSTRVSVWMETLWNPIIWPANALLALLAWGDQIAGILPDAEDFFRRVAVLSDLPWHEKAIILLGANIFLVAEGAYRAVRRREKQRDLFRLTLEQIEEAKPHIILREPGAEYIEPACIQATGNVINTVSLIGIRFVNKPKTPLPNSVARDVRAKIRFFEPIPGGKLLLAIDGRWADSDASSRDWRQSRTDLLRIEFGIEEEHSLDIAFRDEQTGEFYAFNNDNYPYPLMKKPEHLLVGQHFLVRISLLGPWVDETFEFQFAYDSAGTKILPAPLLS